MPGVCQVCEYLSPHPRARITWTLIGFPDAGEESLPGEFVRGLTMYSSFQLTNIVLSISVGPGSVDGGQLHTYMSPGSGHLSRA